MARDFLDKTTGEILPNQALPRIADPEGAADMVRLLCSRDMRWIIRSGVSADSGGIQIWCLLSEAHSLEFT